MSTESDVKRAKQKAYEAHWTGARSQMAHVFAHATPVTEKQRRRWRRKGRLLAIYEKFFSNPDYQVEGWELNPRRVRDQIMGTAK
jgi:hypothetical protein